MATLTTQNISRAGSGLLSFVAAAAGGDSFTPDKDTFIHAINNSGGAITITVVTPRSVNGDIATDDSAVSVGAGAGRLMGPYPADVFADATDGLADLSYSGVTSLTIGVFRIKQP